MYNAKYLPEGIEGKKIRRLVAEQQLRHYVPCQNVSLAMDRT